MNTDLALSEINVAEFIRTAPAAVQFFRAQGTTCVGCILSRFCSLQDVVESYQLDPETFLKELARTQSPE